MRMFLTMLVVGLAIGLVASHAGATSYTPTATPDLSVFGIVVYGDPNAGSGDTFGPVAFGTTGFSGSLHSWVLEDASDNLTFVYRLAIDASSTTDIDMFRLMNATQPFLAVDDSVILGAGYNSTLAGTYPDGVPLWIESYPNDLVPAFEYGWTNPLPPIFDTVGLAPGSTVELVLCQAKRRKGREKIMGAFLRIG